MKKQITRISILQSSKIVTALYALIGLIYTLIGILMLAFGGEEPAMKVIVIIYILAPLWMVILGFIFFSTFADIYNLLPKGSVGLSLKLPMLKACSGCAPTPILRPRIGFFKVEPAMSQIRVIAALRPPVPDAVA